MNLSKNQKGIVGAVEALAVAAVLAFIGFTVVLVINSNVSAEKGITEELLDSLEVADINTLAEMESLASSQLGSASVVGFELDQDGKDTIYKLKLSDKRVLVFNATTGVFLDSETEEGEQGDKLPDNFSTTISFKDALTIAQAERPGKIVSKVEFEIENGVGIYSVRFTDSGRVDVSGSNGDILKVEAGNEAEDEAKDEAEDEAEDTDEPENDSNNNEDDDSDSNDEDEAEDNDNSGPSDSNDEDENDEDSEDSEDSEDDEDEEDSENDEDSEDDEDEEDAN